MGAPKSWIHWASGILHHKSSEHRISSSSQHLQFHNNNQVIEWSSDKIPVPVSSLSFTTLLLQMHLTCISILLCIVTWAHSWAILASVFGSSLFQSTTRTVGDEPFQNMMWGAWSSTAQCVRKRDQKWVFELMEKYSFLGAWIGELFIGRCVCSRIVFATRSWLANYRLQ